MTAQQAVNTQTQGAALSSTLDKPLKSARDNKNLINLENILLIEDKLWTILESFRYL